MSEAAVADLILIRLKQELAALYGPRLKQVLLDGSRARGDFRKDSDYDVMVVLEGPLDDWKELHRLAGLSHDITWDTVKSGNPVVASFKAVTEDQVQQRTGFMHNVRREAVELSSPEAVNYIGIAEAMLDRARRSMLAEIYEDAARNAYQRR